MPKAVSLDVRPKGLASTKVDKQSSASLDRFPGPEKAVERLKAAGARSQPWLDPAGLEAAKGKTELVGPPIYRKR